MKNPFVKILTSLKSALILLMGGIRQYPISFQAVDIVVIDIQKRKLLLGSKWNKEKTLPISEKRFIGGFVDPKDDSLESAAKRELSEEAGANLTVTRPIYIGSFRVNDSRFFNTSDKIMSAVFVTNYVSGPAEAGSDICEVYWEDIESLKIDYQ